MLLLQENPSHSSATWSFAVVRSKQHDALKKRRTSDTKDLMRPPYAQSDLVVAPGRRHQQTFRSSDMTVLFHYRVVCYSGLRGPCPAEFTVGSARIIPWKKIHNFTKNEINLFLALPLYRFNVHLFLVGTVTHLDVLRNHTSFQRKFWVFRPP